MSPRFILIAACALFVLTIGACCATGGGVYEVDGAKFTRTKPVFGAPSAAVAPSVYIDTNASFSGAPIGWARFSTLKPYDIWLSYTDPAATFSSLEVTSVVIRYADGTTESTAISALSLPLRQSFSVHTATNSSSGKVVTTTSSVVQADLLGVITKDQNLEIEIEGYFIEKSGALSPFRIEESYQYMRERKSRPMYEMWKSI